MSSQSAGTSKSGQSTDSSADTETKGRQSLRSSKDKKKRLVFDVSVLKCLLLLFPYKILFLGNLRY